MADPATALNELIRRLLQGALRLSDSNFFRPAGQRAPAGATNAPYATVKLTFSETASYNLRRYDVDDAVVDGRLTDDEVNTYDLAEALDSIDTVTASVQFYRDGAVDGAGRQAWGEGARARAEALVRRLEMSHSAELANAMGLGYVNASQVRDLPKEVDGSIERRAQVDLTFYVSNSEVVALNMFKSASFLVKVQQPNGHIDEVST